MALFPAIHRHRHRRLGQGILIVTANAPEFKGIPSASSVAIWAPLAACLLFTACVAPVQAGVLSGVRGLEAFELPSLPDLSTAKKNQEENRKKYEGYDAKFRSSSFVQELLKRSKENAEKHRQEIQNKYCKRGADWGVGDCSVAAMSEKQREEFMDALTTKEAPQ